MKRHMRVALAVVVFCAGIMAVLTHKGYDMGILNKLFGKRESTSEKKEEASINPAFVLLSEAQLPDAEAVEIAFRDFAAQGEELREEADDSEDGASDQVTSLALNTGEKSFVALMPAAVPNGEADQGAQFSLSRFRNNWELPPHNAHLLVTFHSTPDSLPIVMLSRFTSLLAAVTKASPAVGVYWGNAGATHDPEFFVSVASDQGVVPRMMLWSGVSIAREKDGRLSLLSLGMEQLNLLNLLNLVPELQRDKVTNIYKKLKGTSNYRTENYYGNIEAVQLERKASELGLNVKLEKRQFGGYLPVDSNNIALVIEDDEIAEIVGQKRLEAGVKVIEIHVD